VDASWNIIDAPSFLCDALELTLPAPVTEIFNSDLNAWIAVSRVVAPTGRSPEYHATLVRRYDLAIPIRFWDVTNPADDLTEFYFIDDSSIFAYQKSLSRRLGKAVIDDLSRYMSEHLRPSIGALLALSSVLRDQPTQGVEAASRFLEVLDGLSEATFGLESQIARFDPNVLDHDIPVRVVDVLQILVSLSCDLAVVHTKHDANIHQTFVSSYVVERILEPLLLNAIESRPKDGSVEVIASESQGQVFFEIHDSGRGMSSDELAQSELPFYTTKAGHAGLGLALVRHALIEVKGGMEIRSARKQGTVVRVWVPSMDLADLTAAFG
jgi:signal transduction histidine kinase